MHRLLALLIFLTAFPVMAQSFDDTWISPLNRTHPLVGTIWLPAENRFAGREDLAFRLAAADFVLLGERHDNADHHRLQSWALDQMLTIGRRPLIAFEMIGEDKQDALTGYRRDHPDDIDGLGESVGWATSGWPDWTQYRPLFASAVTANLDIHAANLSADHLKMVARHQALAPALVEFYRLDQPLAPTVYNDMAEEIRQSHCGMLPEAAVGGMVDAQRARDAIMAQSLNDHGTGTGGVLIAGAGHVRTDRGVPAQLKALLPGRSVFSLAFIEVDDQENDPGAYAAAFGAPTLPFDAIWFTPKANDDDPCAEMAAMMKKKTP